MNAGFDAAYDAPKDPLAHRVLRIVAWTLLAVGMVSWFVLGANRPDDPVLVGAATQVTRVTVPGFGTVAFKVAGDATTYCALEAATDAARERGMQHRRDLGGFDAMVFRFDTDTTTSFINHFVPIDLSLGFYDAAGNLIDAKEMAACPTGEGCPSHAARAPFRTAIETPSGGLAQLGLASAGANVTLGGTCT